MGERTRETNHHLQTHSLDLHLLRMTQIQAFPSSVINNPWGLSVWMAEWRMGVWNDQQTEYSRSRVQSLKPKGVECYE
jgi:hypothetical protein